MHSFKDEWNFEMALEVLQSETVDSKIWSDAVKWLMLFGPPQVKELLNQASSMATTKFFPELAPIGYTNEGQPLYDIKALAQSLGMSEEEALDKMAELEKEHGFQNVFAEEESHKVQ